MRFLKQAFAVMAVSLLPLTATAEVLLTLTVGNEIRQYDRETIELMPAESFSTTTTWTKGRQTFTGVSLAKFLADAGVASGTLRATAINDYAVEIPVSDAIEGGPIIAYARNGKAMSVRDKGPLWIVYNYDGNSDYQSEVIYSRSIWQLDRIDVIE